MAKMKVLLIEDNELRLQKLQVWAPDVHFVWAKSAGMALGILERDRGEVYHAIMLDHDLDTSAVVESDHSKDGRDVMASILRNVSRQTPILVHSTNKEYGTMMAEQLEQAGFYVERISMNDLTRASLKEFFDYARDVWEHPTGGIGAGNH
jgi:CheY-like chemotaxis protein